MASNFLVRMLGALALGLLACTANRPARESAEDPQMPRARALEQLEARLRAAVEAAEAPGAVVLIGRGDRELARLAAGSRALEPCEPLTVDTLFDLASLTKPIATATSVMRLVERGEIELDAPLARYLPEFGANGKHTITVEQLLRHWGGLVADNPLSDYSDGAERAWERICALAPSHAPDSKFEYSDVGYLALGVLVERVSGVSLAEFAQREVFEPAGMHATRFTPAASLRGRCAPTEPRNGALLRGEVHDPRAAALGGVAGHAGLFSTADDVARWCRMLLAGGELDGRRVLSRASAEALLTPHWLTGGSGGRTLGLDCDTAFSTVRGAGFPRGVSVGHTGFTGTSLWMDPTTRAYCVVLTSRLHPEGKGDVRGLRSDVATLAAALATPVELAQARPAEIVLTGADVLARESCARLRGCRIALLTNRTGRTRDGERTLDVLRRCEGVELVCAMTPEHGFDAALEGEIENGIDASTGVKLHSLYGATRTPTREMLGAADTIVVDVQDVGVRFYTYATTLGHAMEAAAELGLRVVVLDRPNPLAPLGAKGPLADAERLDFVAYRPIPIVHGLTLGELARLYREHFGVRCELEVVRCEGWKRSAWWSDTGLEWRNPSPNLRNPTQALLYPGVALLEFTNVSVGRGTDEPFERFGAPWIDGPRLANALNQLALPGLRFTPLEFTPSASRFAGELCRGVHIEVVERTAVEPVTAGLALAWTLLRLHGESFDVAKVDVLLRNHAAWEALLRARSAAELPSGAGPEFDAYLAARAKVLLYE
jgi:uncharacterized protein YbbC (DUF1343 family)/CubicO group peptidase (beta-lactamase class C family)